MPEEKTEDNVVKSKGMKCRPSDRQGLLRMREWRRVLGYEGNEMDGYTGNDCI